MNRVQYNNGKFSGCKGIRELRDELLAILFIYRRYLNTPHRAFCLYHLHCLDVLFVANCHEDKSNNIHTM